MLNPLDLVRELVAIPGPPGQEEAVRAAVAAHAGALGCVHKADPRGNLLIAPPGMDAVPDEAEILVMAHLDEIALMVVRMEPDGRLLVTNQGGLMPWKWGEGPVTILTPEEPLTGILSFGSIHTSDRGSAAARAREDALTWDMARVFTGMSPEHLAMRGVRPGTRVALHPSRRLVTEFGSHVTEFGSHVTEFGSHVAAPFLDDRADLAALLLALESLTASPEILAGRKVVFAATAAEEVGGHGALWLLHQYRPAVGIALEVGPRVPESPFPIDAQPTVWVNDSYSAMQARDIELVAAAADDCGLSPHWQALSRGGSDASCAASHGLVARPITLAFAAENTHGCEIMHRNALPNLSLLLTATLNRLAQE